MICNLRMLNIGTRVCRHVTPGAVRLVDMMFLAEPDAMTRTALFAVIRDPILCRWRAVRIVTTRPGHPVARLFLADALRQGFELAGGAQVRLVFIGANVIPHIVVEIVARTELVQMPAWALNSDIPFEMTLHANCITLHCCPN